MQLFSLKALLALTLALTLAFTLSGNVYAWTDDLALKGGVNVSWLKLSALNDSVEHTPTAGFNTHFGYKWKKFELSVSSYISFNEFNDLDLKAQEIKLEGVEGGVLNLAIAPLLKWHTDWEIKPAWTFYFGVGPSWSLLTIKLDDDITEQGFGPDDKFVYESHGASLVLGVEEQTLYKEMHPVYFELHIQYQKSHELSTVDAGESDETNILSKEEIRQIETIYYMISMGITIF